MHLNLRHFQIKFQHLKHFFSKLHNEEVLLHKILKKKFSITLANIKKMVDFIMDKLQFNFEFSFKKLSECY